MLAFLYAMVMVIIKKKMRVSLCGLENWLCPIIYQTVELTLTELLNSLSEASIEARYRQNVSGSANLSELEPPVYNTIKTLCKRHGQIILQLDSIFKTRKWNIWLYAMPIREEYKATNPETHFEKHFAIKVCIGNEAVFQTRLEHENVDVNDMASRMSDVGFEELK